MGRRRGTRWMGWGGGEEKGQRGGEAARPRGREGKRRQPLYPTHPNTSTITATTTLSLEAVSPFVSGWHSTQQRVPRPPPPRSETVGWVGAGVKWAGAPRPQMVAGGCVGAGAVPRPLTDAPSTTPAASQRHALRLDGALAMHMVVRRDCQLTGPFQRMTVRGRQAHCPRHRWPWSPLPRGGVGPGPTPRCGSW